MWITIFFNQINLSWVSTTSFSLQKQVLHMFYTIDHQGARCWLAALDATTTEFRWRSTKFLVPSPGKLRIKSGGKIVLLRLRRSCCGQGESEIEDIQFFSQPMSNINVHRHFEDISLRYQLFLNRKWDVKPRRDFVSFHEFESYHWWSDSFRIVPHVMDMTRLGSNKRYIYN